MFETDIMEPRREEQTKTPSSDDADVQETNQTSSPLFQPKSKRTVLHKQNFLVDTSSTQKPIPKLTLPSFPKRTNNFTSEPSMHSDNDNDDLENAPDDNDRESQKSIAYVETGEQTTDRNLLEEGKPLEKKLFKQESISESEGYKLTTLSTSPDNKPRMLNPVLFRVTPRPQERVLTNLIETGETFRDSADNGPDKVSQEEDEQSERKELEPDEQKDNDNKTEDQKDDDDGFSQNIDFGVGRNQSNGLARSDTIQSSISDSRYNSQVINIDDYDKIMVEAAQPQSHRKSKFRPAVTEELESLGISRPTPRKISTVKPKGRDSVAQNYINKEVPRINKYWKRLNIVMRSIIYMKSEGVRSIDSPDDMLYEMEHYEMKKIRRLHAQGTETDLANDDFIKEALDSIRRTEILCECATVGSEKHLKLAQKVLDEYPQQNLLSRADKSHILNKHGHLGQNSLYLAAKFGNLQMVKFFIEQQANPHIESNLDSEGKIKEKCLHVATRWGYDDVVEYLLEHGEWNPTDLKTAIKQTSRKGLKNMIIRHYEKQFGSLGCLFRCLWF